MAKKQKTRAELAKDRKQNMLEIGQSGTDIWNGIIDHEYNPKLSDTAGIEIYEEMRKSDATVKAVLLATSLPIRRANWFVKTASEDDKDKEIRDFVSKALFDYMSINWDDFLRQALLAMPFGVMVFEKVFDIRNIEGKDMIVWRKFAPRLPSSIISWEAKPGEDGITQQLNTGADVKIPMDKLLVFVHEKEGDNWWGTSVLRAAYKPWYIKSNLEKIDAIAHERQGIGIPFVQVEQNATPEELDKAETTLKNLRSHQNAYIIEPKDMPVEFKDMKASSTKDPSKSIAYQNRQITLSVLAQFLDLGSGATGSRALSQDQTDLFLQSLEAVANAFINVVNKYAIPQLVDLNYDSVDVYPELGFSNLSRKDMAALSQTYQRLTQTGGIQNNVKDEEYFRTELGLPQQERDEEDDELEELKMELDTLAVELATAEGDESDMTEQEKTEASEQDKLDAQLFDEMVNDELILMADPSSETKSKISEALKKYWASRKKNDDDAPEDKDQQVIDAAKSKISEAKRNVEALRSILRDFREKSKGIKNRKAKKAFRAAMKAQIKEVRAMVKAARKEMRKQRKIKRAARKRQIKRRKIARIKKRITKSNARIAKLKQRLAKAKTSAQREKLRERLQDAKDKLEEQKEDLQEVNASEPKKKVEFAENDFKPFRKLTFAEKKVNWQSIQDFMDKNEAALTKESRAVLNKAKDDYITRINAAVAKGDNKKVKTLQLKFQSEYSALVKKFIKEAYIFGKNNVATEMKVPTPASNAKVLSSIDLSADTIAKKHADDLVNQAKLTIVEQVGKGNTVAQAIAKADTILTQKILTLTRDTSSIVTAGHVNLGRKTVFDKHADKIYALQRSEILDKKTCNFCLSFDGRIISKNDPLAKVGTVHSNCRGIWVEILEAEEDKPKITGVPKSIRDRVGDATNEVTQPPKPIVKKNSAAAKKIDQGKAGQ